MLQSLGMSSPEPLPPGVVVLGDINVDVFARISEFPSPGEDCLVPALELHCGGVGVNAALALARWGVPVRLVGRAGRDCFGELALGFLRRERIDVSWVQQADDALTGVMFIAVTPDGQRTMFGSRGANANLSRPANAGYLENAGALYLVGYNFLTAAVSDVAEQLLEEARQRGALVSLDVGMAPSQQVPQKILQVARKADILFAARDEAAALTGKSDAMGALSALEACGVREAVMKLGERGSWFLESGARQEVPFFSVKAVDTTGAGDAFAAAFLRARLHGWSRAEAALVANAAGAVTASRVGAGDAMPTPVEIQRLLRASRLDARWEPVRVRVLERLKEELGLQDSGDD
jgi:ribokinase